MASTSGRSFILSSSKSQLPTSNSLAPLPSAPLQRRQRSRAARPNGIVVAQAGQLPPAPVRGGGGRGSQEASSSTAAQRSTTTAPLTSSSSSSSSSSLATSAAVGALLAAAAAWAASSFARERGAVSSSASAAGLRGEANAGRSRRGGSRGRGWSWGRKKPASDDSDFSSSGPPPRSYRAALSVTRRSVALTRAVQAADFGNIAAALTELDRALAEHAAAGGSWEERTSGEMEEGGGEGEQGRRRKASLLPSGVGEEDVSLFLFSFIFTFPSPIPGRSFRKNGKHKKKKTHPPSKRKKLKISTDAAPLRPPPAELGGPLLVARRAGAAAVAAQAERGGGEGGRGRGDVRDWRVFHLMNFFPVI